MENACKSWLMKNEKIKVVGKKALDYHYAIGGDSMRFWYFKRC